MTTAANPSDSLSALDLALAKAQVDDAFAAVTVTVPSPFARVQLRRALGARRGLCNVSFRTWGELTGDLGRAALGLRSPTPSVIDEALRQALKTGSSPFEILGQSASARGELVSLLLDLWRSGPGVLLELAERGGRAGALVDVLKATEAYLGSHGFADPGSLLDAAARADIAHVGAVVRWYPRPLRGRERLLLDHLVASGVPVTTIEAGRQSHVAVDRSVPCGDPDTEVRVTLRAVLDDVEAGIPLYRQAIVHPPLDRYRRAVHQQLAAADIPRSGPSPLMLDDSATGRALLGLLRLADGRWSRTDVLRWLDCAPVTATPGGPRPPVSRWDEISARAGVIEGLEQWRARLERFAAGGRPFDVHVATSAAEADAAAALAAFVDRLADELSEPGQRWSEWAAWAEGLLDRHLDPDEHLDWWPSEEVVSAVAVRALLADLAGLDLISPGCDLASFRHAVERELASRPIRNEADVAAPASEGGSPDPPPPAARELPGPVGRGIFVGSPSEVRGMAFARVHLVGMADQFLPGSPSRTALLPDADIADPDWPSPARALDELHDDMAVLTGLAERTRATWPVVDPRTGRENTRSRWLESTETGSNETDDAVSFALDVSSGTARALPLSRADRLLCALVESGDTPLDERAPVRDQPVEGTELVAPLRESVIAAGLPGQSTVNRFDGWLDPTAAPLVDGELAPTSLEEYAVCPRQYLFHRQLRVSKALRPEAIEEMDPLQRGSLTHEVLAAYVAERLQRGTPPDLDRLLEIGREHFSKAEAEGRCGPPVIAAVERSRLVSELRLFFHDDLLEPLEVELAFGNPRLPEPEEVAEPDDPGVPALTLALPGRRPVQFRGRIDRIDRGPRGTVVSDYKTGRADVKGLLDDPVAGGTKLQLVLYGLVARALWPEGPVLSRYWYTSPGRDNESVICEIDDRTSARFDEVVADIVSGIESGAFPGNPGPETYRNRPTFEHCAYCDFDRVCPTDRDRRFAGALDTEAAEPLGRLTGPPPDEVVGLVRKADLDLSRKGMA